MRLKAGAEGRIRTGTGFNSQRFLRPPRLPFRHFGQPVRRRGQRPECNRAADAPPNRALKSYHAAAFGQWSLVSRPRWQIIDITPSTVI